jgi:3-phenylpropionate/trans-cinnamate dioxygenase ferredoxin reductase component
MSAPAGHVVIVGGGHSGGTAASALRDAGHQGPVTIIGRENHPPYERPPLSKELLDSAVPVEKTYLRPAAWYEAQGIALKLGHIASAIDREAKRVQLEDGRAIPYDTLLLATGARARRLPLPGGDGPHVYYLRDIEDSLALRQRLVPGVRLAVIGAGFIGLEVAAIARKRGVAVTVIELAPHVLARVAPSEIADFIADLHRRNDVEVLTNVAVTAIEDGGSGLAIRSAAGATIGADFAAIGIGAMPNTELAAAAGLEVKDGIVVDQFGRSSDPSVYAAGDVTRHFNPILGRHIRLEAWQNAQNQAIAVAKIIAGSEQPFAEVPWFWTDQYDVNLQMAGAPLAWDRVVWRGTREEGKFTLFQLAEGKPVSAITVNNARDMRFARQLVGLGRAVDPAALADRNMKLQDLCR